MELELRPFDCNVELKAQRDLFMECFPETIGTPDETFDHYNWKFHSCRNIPQSYEFAAYSGNDMLGYYASIPYKYNYFNKEITAAMVCDVMTGINARGKGVFVKLGNYSNQKFKEAGLEFSSGFPIRPEVIPGHLKVGWEILFDLPLYARFLKFNTFFRSRKKAFLIPFFNFGVIILNFSLNIFFREKRNITVENYSSNELNKIDGLFHFLTEWQSQVPISLIKDNKFITWRLSAPKKEYNISILRNNNKIVGYAVSRYTIKEGVPSIGVLDIALLDGFYHLSRYLLRDVDRFAKEKNAEFIFMMISRFWSDKYLIWKSGYLKTTYKFRYIFKRLNFDIDDKRPYDVRNWHLMWIDSDDL